MLRVARIRPSSLVAFLLCAVPPFGLQASWSNGNSARSYRTGPLTLKDFQATPPESSLGLDAFTTSEMRYDYKYQVRFTRRRATAYVSELTVDAVVIPSKSWIKRRMDVRLLDHEQGHFDVTCIEVLRVRLQFAKLARRNQRILATGATPEVAIQNVKREMNDFMQPFLDSLAAEQESYDTLTQHGLRRETQAQQRRMQQETIKQLLEELKSIEVSGTSRRP